MNPHKALFHLLSLACDAWWHTRVALSTSGDRCRDMEAPYI